jgi:predicted permease
LIGLARHMVRAAGFLVPGDLRAEWQRDWESELAWTAERGAPAQLRRAMGAWPHALWLRLDRWRWDVIWQDIRQGTRALRARPGFTVVAIITLALGLGVNAAIFSAVRAVLLRPLPYPEPERLVSVSSASLRGGAPFGGAVSPPDFADWQREGRAFQTMAALTPSGVALTGDGPAEQVQTAQVTGGFFDVLGVAPLRGRALTLADDPEGAGKLVVLSHGIWQRRYGSDPGVVGRSILLDGVPHQVIGVMPAGFAYPASAEMWTPLRFSARDLATQRGAHYLEVIGRVSSAGSPSDARAAAAAEMRGVGERLAADFPSTNRDTTVATVPLREALVGDVRRPLLTLFGAVAAVLLIVCANIASLSLTRAMARGREFAIRASLGASRGRMVRALIVESLLLSVAGGAAGLLLASWMTGGIAALSDRLGVSLLADTRIDATVGLFMLAATAVTAILCGALPGWQAASRGDLARRIREDGTNTTADRNRLRARGALIVAESALAVLLLVGAGLLVRSFMNVTAVDLGIDAERVSKFDVTLPEQTYATAEQRAVFVETLVGRLQALPEVGSASAIFGMPLTGFAYGITAAYLDGRHLTSEEQNARILQVRVVTPGYFETMAIPLQRGRAFAATDRLGTEQVAILNEAAAALLWPGESALGHRVEIGTRLGGETRAGGQVVGIAGDVRDFGAEKPVRPTIYLPHAQRPTDFVSVVMRARTDVALNAQVRDVVASLDPAMPVFAERTVTGLAGESMAQRQLMLRLIGGFAALAAVLAALGIYGLLSHVVGQRTREIGLRVALGARQGRVMGMVISEALRLTAVGLVIGLAAAYFLSGSVSALLFGTEASDPGTYVAVGAAFLLVALVAAWLPARRAAAIDPLIAMRSQ